MDADPKVEELYALGVDEPHGYARYRREMTPLLHAAGGRFGLDLWTREVLVDGGAGDFNRLFTMQFPSLDVRMRFFADPQYLAVRRTHFEQSVRRVARLGRLER